MATATATAKEEDQILARLGHIGAWQWKVILITGLFSAPSVCHVMIMTFMNAEVNFSKKWMNFNNSHCPPLL